MPTLRRHYHLLIPALLILAYAAPLTPALLPSLSDDLTESYEPMKTLTFVYSRGTAFHKWGNLPSALYAPVYAPWLGYWYLTGRFHKPTDSALSAFADPVPQFGALILTARLAGLLACLAALLLTAHVLAQAAGSRRAVLLAVLLCAATAPDLIFYFVSTKPDGLMLAFLLLSTAVYARILTAGFTLRRGVLLSLAAVASISCKEQTAPAFIAMYAWIFLSGLGGKERFLKDYARTLLAGVGFYALLNVVYAPAAWWQHIEYWISGPGKDPEVWSRPNYTLGTYLGDAFEALLFNLGPGGSALVAAAAVLSLRYRSRLLAGAWAPVAGYLALMLLSAGYIQRYFLLPVTALCLLPVTLVLARAEAEGFAAERRRLVLAAFTVALAANLWGGNLAWAQVRQGAPWITEQYARHSLSNQDSVSFAYPWKVPPGSSRLAQMGYRVDDRPLGELLLRPPEMPDVVLITREWDDWLRDFKNRPARNTMYESTGYTYSSFEGLEPLGYELAEVVSPTMPLRLNGWLWPPYRVAAMHDVLVYRRARNPKPGPR